MLLHLRMGTGVVDSLGSRSKLRLKLLPLAVGAKVLNLWARLTDTSAQARRSWEGGGGQKIIPFLKITYGKQPDTLFCIVLTDLNAILLSSCEPRGD